MNGRYLEAPWGHENLTPEVNTRRPSSRLVCLGASRRDVSGAKVSKKSRALKVGQAVEPVVYLSAFSYDLWYVVMICI